MILDIIKKLKYEYNRKEEIKHKDENIQKLDEKAVLLNLKKEEEVPNQENEASSELQAANISTSTCLALHNGETNNNLILLPPNDEKK